MPAVLGPNSYGKSLVRLLKVRRNGEWHEITEVSVDTALEGEFLTAHTEGDNSRVLPTDTQKNTVYALAHGHSVECIEDFGLTLARHFIDTQPDHVRAARVALEESPWRRILVGGVPHGHAFESGGNERRRAVVSVRGRTHEIEAGLHDLLVMKTTRSGFVGYVRDRFTTLKETTDRIFATSVTATWRYAPGGVDYNASFGAIRRALVETFAVHDSLSVQQTLYAMGEAALAAAPAVTEIRISLPNKHCLLVNLAPFGMDNDNEIFVPTSEPHGLIEATILRG